MKQLLWVLVLAIVAGLAAWGLTLVHPTGQQLQSQAETHVLSGTATTTANGPALEYKEDHPYYTVDIVYPETNNQQEQTAIEGALKAELDAYAQNVANLDATMMPSLGQGYKLALSITYKSYKGTLPQGPVTSYLFTYYEDTGGAHPNASFKTFVFDQSGKALTIHDIVGADLSKLASLTTAQVEAQVKQRLGQSDISGSIFSEGLAPTDENFSTFVIDGSDLVLELPPYQVAAYAMGSFEVRIPLSSLK